MNDFMKEVLFFIFISTVIAVLSLGIGYVYAPAGWVFATFVSSMFSLSYMTRIP